MQSFQDIEHFVKTLSAAIKKKIPTKVSQLTNDAGYKTTDTTYKLSKTGSTVTLTGSDGSTTSVTDSNTTYSSLKNPYSLDIQNNGTTVASYDGSTAKTANFTNATTSANGLMSAADKTKLDGIDPSAITTNAANIKKNADAISAETTRAKKAEEANTQLTNDLKTGLTSGTVKVAKATVADSASSLGKVSTYQTGIPDNGGRRKYLLMYDITDWVSAKSNASTRAFDGYFFSRRSGGYVGTNYTGNLSIVASYNGVNSDGSPIKSDNGISLRLRTTSSTYVPRILHQKSNDKYYLSLMTGDSGRDLILFGIFQGTFIGTWINNEGANNSNGTLPSDYEEYSDGFYSIPYEKAVCDKNGKDITEYLVAAAYADGAFTFTRGNGDKTVLTIPDAVSNTINTHIANKSNPHAVTKAQVGLGNVDNTADSAKSVKYAASAGSANAVAWGNVSGKPSTYPPSSHTHTPAQVGLGNVANLDQSKAIKSITRNGTTFTATALDGTTSTFTQQDTNTTYGLASQSSNGLMSAADKKAVDREFFRMLPKGGTVIPNGANLNSTAYLKVGNYYQPANVNTTNMTNIPFKAAFMMYVLSPLSEVYDNESTAQWVYRIRIFINFTGENIFVQKVSSGSTVGNFTYGPWIKQTNSNDLGVVSNTIDTHIANKSNPHAVTKAQVGLGSVANLDQSKAIKSITRSGTTFTATALDGTTTTFTQQDNNTTYGIATSSADGLMSKSDKAKLDGISSSADVSSIKTIKVNGTALTPDTSKAVNVTVPTLANNATTTTSGMALDARMGKTLSDQISSVKVGAIDQIVNLTAKGWTGDAAPYSQTVNVTGMAEDLLCELFSACPKSATVAEREAYNEAFALVASGYAETANGSATFLVDDKPAIDIGVRIKSISKANAVSDQTSSDISNAVDAMSNTLEGRINALWEKIYPVGSIYISANSTSPAEMFGGTWKQIKDRFLLAAGDNYAAGSTGGEAQHTLTVDEMPSHNHSMPLRCNWTNDTDGVKMEWALDMSFETGDGVGTWPSEGGTGATGSNNPHNNMPPYIVVYMWKRVS